MFYEPDREPHGLAHNPFKSCIVPRPIGWITTLKGDGKVNLAPFSQFNLIGYEPGYVGFSASVHPPDWRGKDSVQHVERSGEFVYNMATYDLRDKVDLTSQIIESDIDEMQAAGLTPAPGRTVKTPRVAESPVAFECKHFTTVFLPGNTVETRHYLVIGRVVGVYIAYEAIGADGKLDIPKIKPLARIETPDRQQNPLAFQAQACAQRAGARRKDLVHRVG